MRPLRCIIILSLTGLFIITVSCEKDLELKSGIRPLVYLTTEDIPTFTGMTQTKHGQFPQSIPYDLPSNYSPEIEFRWESHDGNYVYIDVCVTENELAIIMLIEAHKYYVNPFIEDNKDDPAVVGDHSYFGGKEFVRDNLIVKIHTSEKFDGKTTEIAKHIDTKIKNGPIFKSLEEFKPSINKFDIEDNPVVELSKTPFLIEVDDPNNKKLIALLSMQTVIGMGGSILNDGIDNCYFLANSVYDDLETNVVDVSVVVINEFGFWAKSDSVVRITTVKDPNIN